MVDSKGVLNNKRKDLNKYKQEFVTERDIDTLEQAVKGADLFLGLSAANMMTKEMLASMADNPIVFAMANPDPEISYEDAMATRKDLIFATGRSDYPNQINNVLGFPFIFRGALDVRASTINEEMKMAASKALAELAKKPVPDCVLKAYNVDKLVFGRSILFQNHLIQDLYHAWPLQLQKQQLKVVLQNIRSPTGMHTRKVSTEDSVNILKRSVNVMLINAH